MTKLVKSYNRNSLKYLISLKFLFLMLIKLFTTFKKNVFIGFSQAIKHFFNDYKENITKSLVSNYWPLCIMAIMNLLKPIYSSIHSKSFQLIVNCTGSLPVY